MALIDKLSDLTSFEYKKVGDFESIDVDSSPLTELPRPEIDTDTSPPEIKGREQALQAVEDVGVEKTALFVGKQALLHRQNAQEDTRVYDPTSLVKNLAVATDNIVGRGTNENESLIEKAVGQDISYAKPEKGIILGAKKILGINEIEDKTPTGRQKSLTITQDDVSYNMRNQAEVVEGQRVRAGRTLELNEDKLPKDFIKFRIKDSQNNRIIQFPAYLSDISDNSSAEFNPTRYIGRADQVYVYSGYSRSISFGFRVAALTRGDVPVMWNKIDHLKQLALPTYSDKVFPTSDSSEKRPVAPFVELTIGDMYVDQPGYFSGINLTIPQTSTWETEDGYQLTHLCDVSLEFTYIGKGLPQNRPEGRIGTPQFDMEEVR